jgi:hypothetical protein
MFSTLCTVEADISHIENPPKTAPHDSSIYYTVNYDVIFSFGLTELKAFIAWKENVSPILVIKDSELRVATNKICLRVAGR